MATLGIAQMFAAIKRQRKPVTTTIGVLLTLPVQQLPMGAAHAQKVLRSVVKVRLFFLLLRIESHKLHFTNI
jgi:hypothetical protein